MKIDINYGKGVLSLPKDIIEYTDKADYLALRLFMIIASDDTLRASLDTSELAKKFAVTKEKLCEAIDFWVNAGLITVDEKECVQDKKRLSVSVKKSENGESVTVVSSDVMPNYTGREIVAIMAENNTLASLIDECQRILGKVFGAHEINRLIGMSDYLNLGNEFIVMLFEYCKRLEKNSVAYIEKVAFSLVKEGIVTYPALEEYITSAERVHTLEGKVRRLAGLSARAFSAKEKRFISKWSELAVSEEFIEMAYEVTVNNTGAFSFPYMNKVIINWSEAGYKTAEDVQNALNAYKNRKDETKASFDVNEFFEAALKRSYDRMENKN